jgi:pseudo-response regulator 5
MHDSFISLFVLQSDRYGNKRIEPSVQQQLFPSLCITHQDPGYGKDPFLQSSEVLPSRGHNADESTMQAWIPLDSSTYDATIMCSSSAREDAGTSGSSHRKDSMSHPSYGFIHLPIPVGATMPYHYSAILQPLYYRQAPLMHSDSAGINKATFQHASGQSNYHENTSKTSHVDEPEQLEEDQQLHHSRQLVRESGDAAVLARAHVEYFNESASCSQDIRKGSGCTGSAENDINTNMVVALESGNESGVQNCGYNGLDSDRACREAALMKFRMKRKDRCFEKKVLLLDHRSSL